MSSITRPVHRMLGLMGLEIRLRRNLIRAREVERRERWLSPWQRALQRNYRVILDVGANTGQFASLARELLPSAKIYSFEPLPEVHQELTQRFSNDPLLTPVNIALGARNGRQWMYRSAFSPSSSLLEMCELHVREWPQSEELSCLEVDVVRLDDWISARELQVDSSWLAKIDVQGAEDSVLEGGADAFRRLGAMIIEVSYVEFYKGQPLFDDIHVLMTKLGFAFQGNVEQYCNKSGNEVLFADALYVNKNPVAST